MQPKKNYFEVARGFLGEHIGSWKERIKVFVKVCILGEFQQGTGTASTTRNAVVAILKSICWQTESAGK